ncbi:MAG: thymidylate synthase [Rhodobacteraceae bacterium]|jgi:hypothetical protein|nr:thymidylate synthase [Paracoccaceae bacterium]
MNRIVASLVLPAFLLACGGGSNPFEPAPEPPAEGEGEGEEETPEEGGIPDALANNVTKLVFDPVAQTLTVEGVNFDEVPFTATYTRSAAFDRNGYQAFTAQNDPLDRHNTAFGKQTNNEANVRAGVALSGGPRNRFFGGGYYDRDGAYTPPEVAPDSGLVSYSGSYVGLVNIGFRDDGPTSQDDLLDVPPGTAGELLPSQAGITEGKVFVNADFADASVEGNIYDRRLVDPTNGQTAIAPDGRPLLLPSVVMVSTPISDDGTFEGQMEYDQRHPLITTPVIGTKIGDFGGIFGGTDASGVAGIVKLDEFDGPNNPYGLESEIEYGVFVLDQCGQPVEDTVGCAGTNP